MNSALNCSQKLGFGTKIPLKKYVYWKIRTATFFCPYSRFCGGFLSFLQKNSQQLFALLEQVSSWTTISDAQATEAQWQAGVGIRTLSQANKPRKRQKA